MSQNAKTEIARKQTAAHDYESALHPFPKPTAEQLQECDLQLLEESLEERVLKDRRSQSNTSTHREATAGVKERRNKIRRSSDRKNA